MRARARARRLGPEATASVVDRFLASDAYRRAGTLALYIAGEGEVDPAAIADRARSDGKRVVYPRIAGPGSPLEFAPGDTGFRPGRFRIPEPAAGAVPLRAIDCFVVPGIAFDRRGSRLGRGAGYYDRTLAQVPGATRAALAFDHQLVARVPIEPQDAALDLIVLAAEVIQARRGAA